MKKEVSPALVGIVVVALMVLIGVAYWLFGPGHKEWGLPRAGEAAKQPPPPPGMGAPPQSGRQPGASPLPR